LLGDTIIDSIIPITRQLIDIYEQYRQTIIATEIVPEEKVSRYGIIDGKKIDDSIWNISDLIEKPDVDKSPSNLAIAGRYILTPEIFKILENTEPGKLDEIQLTDALKQLLNRENIYSYVIEGKRYDIGSKLDYLKTIVDFGLKRKEFSKEFKEYMFERLNKK
jgi:UTP--glucose-1-phosphate uridylyltransferase